MIRFNKNRFIKDRKGFTLIELIVVMAVIAILVLLAMPKFMNYAEEARVTRIKNDVKVAEDMATEYLVEYDKFPGDWDSILASELETIKDENRLYEKEGLAKTVQSGEYVAVDNDFIKTKVRSRLKGTFYANLDAKVYYEDSKASKSNNDDNGGENEGNTYPEGCPTDGLRPTDFPVDTDIFYNLGDEFILTVNNMRELSEEEANMTVSSFGLNDSEYIINITYLRDENTDIEYMMTMVEFMVELAKDEFPEGTKYMIAMRNKWISEDSEYDEQNNVYLLNEEGEILFSNDTDGLLPTHIGIYNDNWEKKPKFWLLS